MATVSTSYDKNPWLHYQAALKVARLLQANKFDAYLIGGAVRDILLGQIPKDFDLVTNATPDQIMNLSGISQAIFTDPAQAFGVSRVKVALDVRGQPLESVVEVATYRRDIEAHLGRKATKVEFANLEDDVLRRDFTINALALDLANDFLVDYVDGIKDLDNKIIRFIGDSQQRIAEDPLRIIRAIRFKAQLNFSYQPDTKAALASAIKAGQLATIPTERLVNELTLMLVSPKRAEALTDMLDLGLLDQVLPEVVKLKGTAQQPQYHREGDVWTHTLLALGYLPSRPSPRLAWATLLHDIGKPATATPTHAATKVEFPGHYEIGAQMAEVIAKRLGLPKRLAADITWMVRYHMGIDDLPKMRPGRRHAFLGHPAFSDLLAMHRADAHASWHAGVNGETDKTAPSFPLLDQLAREHQRLKTKQPPSFKRDLGVDGNWLIKQFKLERGPKLGRILGKLNEAYLDGEVKTKSEAKSLAAELLKD